MDRVRFRVEVSVKNKSWVSNHSACVFRILPGSQGSQQRFDCGSGYRQSVKLTTYTEA